jgi:hypothetical protein
MEQDMTNFPTMRVFQDDVDRWMEYFRHHVAMTAERAEFARELLIDWLVRIGAMEPPR